MATKYNVTINERYYCAYIPSARSQKFQFDEVEGEIKVSVPQVSKEEAPVAFRLSDYHHTSEQQTEIRFYGGRLWRQSTLRHTGGPELVVEHLKAEDLSRELRPNLPYGHARSRELCTKKYRKEAERYLVIEGELWQQTGEPRYVINTFGLGHNHGGTGLFVEEWYNENISRERYFSALDGERAVAEANRIAERRGDTNDVGRFQKMIEVLIPEAVTIQPMLEHGEGDPFINKIDSITESAPDTATAGLLAMMVTAQELSK